MEIEAVKFVKTGGDALPVRRKLKIKDSRDLEALKAVDTPVAYVIRVQDLSLFRKFKEAVNDRGTKHKSTELSRILLGQTKIPLLDGEYSSSKRLENGISALLEKANEAYNNEKETQKEDLKYTYVFIIGVAETIFSQLALKKVQACGPEDDAQKIKVGLYRWKAKSGDDERFPGSIMKLMQVKLLPAELVEKYIGNALEVEFVRQMILHAAATDDPVLILGDSGTGKEIVAHQIHHYSDRSQTGDFATVNCGAISHYLLESELFGHVKGAFTGAFKHKPGLWQTVKQGTLFLDEVGDLLLAHQVKILRALQEGKIRKVGGDQDINVDARVIAATNRDLFAMVQTGQFREDLFFRLRGFLIRTPPLRNHIEDIPILAKTFWEQTTQDASKQLPDEIIAELKAYKWPGNVRELKTVLKTLHSLFHSAANLNIEHLRAVFQLQGQVTSPGALKASERIERVDCLHHLKRVFEAVRASQVAMEPVIKEQKTDADTAASVYMSLQHRLDEFDWLCRYPKLFHTPFVFDTVNMLRSKIMFFQSLLDANADEALTSWQQHAADAFDNVLSTVMKEAGDLMKSE